MKFDLRKALRLLRSVLCIVLLVLIIFIVVVLLLNNNLMEVLGE